MMEADHAVLYVGRRATLRYVSLCLALFHSGYDKVKIKARGNKIPKAIEIVERIRKHFMRNVVIEDVEIGSDIIISRGGVPRRVSTIAITLSQGGGS
ncbi:MAG: hypothetical protein J7L38_06740 [Thermoproteales archaeon]|nr:hypothetical protein [Thermoproteales archaeon]RLE62475.1 MAG: RNA-binding protein [Thermoprotei archaeon]